MVSVSSSLSPPCGSPFKLAYLCRVYFPVVMLTALCDTSNDVLAARNSKGYSYGILLFAWLWPLSVILSKIFLPNLEISEVRPYYGTYLSCFFIYLFIEMKLEEHCGRAAYKRFCREMRRPFPALPSPPLHICVPAVRVPHSC